MSIAHSFTKSLHATALAAAAWFGVVALGGVPAVASAAAPQVRTQAPGYYRVMLGDFEVTALSDGTVDLDAEQLLHEPAAETATALKKSFVGNPFETSVNAFLVNTGGKLVLIDTGAGALFGPTLGKLLENLRASGYRPEQIDDIFLTHLHPDHIGGLMADGALAFPNATVHADKRESDFWLSQANMDKAPADAKGFFQGAMSSLQPYVAAGHYQAFESDAELVAGVHPFATLGHTVGHTSYVVESRGQRLVVVGDLIHVAPVQFDDPTVTIAFDSDGKTAEASRARVFAQVAKDGTLIAAAHLQFPGMGHLKANGAGYRFVPVNYTRMR